MDRTHNRPTNHPTPATGALRRVLLGSSILAGSLMLGTLANATTTTTQANSTLEQKPATSQKIQLAAKSATTAGANPAVKSAPIQANQLTGLVTLSKQTQDLFLKHFTPR